MADPWEKQKGDTRKSFPAFCDFLQMGPRRTLPACAKEYGHRFQSLSTWSSKHNWTDRSAAYDVQELLRAKAQHEQKRAEIRQRFIDRGLEMADIAMSVAAGRAVDPCVCEDRKPGEPCTCGAWTAIRDREGRYIGDKPMVSPSTRGVNAIQIVNLCGVTVPKRVELTGADGEALLNEAQASLATLSPAAFAALKAAYPDDDGDS